MGDKGGSSFMDLVLDLIIIPGGISLLLYLLLTFALIPAWRHYRARHAQYLPIDSLSLHTSSLRDRLTERFAAFANRREDRYLRTGAPDIDHQDEQIDDGEELGDVDNHMRRVIESHERTLGTRPDNARRLSRDLEEGFRDDSDDEPDRYHPRR